MFTKQPKNRRVLSDIFLLCYAVINLTRVLAILAPRVTV